MHETNELKRRKYEYSAPIAISRSLSVKFFFFGVYV